MATKEELKTTEWFTNGELVKLSELSNSEFAAKFKDAGALLVHDVTDEILASSVSEEALLADLDSIVENGKEDPRGYATIEIGCVDLGQENTLHRG